MVNCRLVCLALLALAVKSAAIDTKGKAGSLQTAKTPVQNLNVNIQSGKKPAVTKKKATKKATTKKIKEDAGYDTDPDDEYGYEDDYYENPNNAGTGPGYTPGFDLLGNSQPLQESAQGLANLFVNALGKAVNTATKTITGVAKTVTSPITSKATGASKKSEDKPIYYPDGPNKPVPSTPTPKPASTGINLSTGEGLKPKGALDYKLMLKLVNKFRASNGKQPLKYNKLLNRAAQLHSKDQSVHNEMTHDGSDGSKPSQRIERIGYNWENVAENVAWNQKSVPLVLKAWINSPGHRRNLLGDYKEFGAGFDNYYWTQEFGSQFVD